MGSNESEKSPGKPDRIEDRLFINGEFVPSVSGKKIEIYNPTTEKLTASIYEAGVEDVDNAIAAAKAAFPAWSELSADARAAYLIKLADAMAENLDEMGYLEAVTMGKPYIGDPFGSFSIHLLKTAAAKAMDIQGTSSLNTSGQVNVSLRQPYGVCGAIIPWNVPLYMLVNKVGPALITGNTLVLKTSEKSPLSALVIARLCQEIGLPKGVLNILSGMGRPCGEAIAKHMEIRKISFTGSTGAGRAIKRAAVDSNLKNVTLELGGKNPLLIFEDADLTKAIPAIAFSILINSGQSCVATSRVYVHESIADKVTEMLKEAMTKMGEVGDPLVEGTRQGPQADKLQVDRIMGFFDSAKQENLDMVLGGKRVGSQGYFIEPTLIRGPLEDSRVMREETFGPVACLNTFTDEDEVIRRANDSEYGLYASVFTRDISRALRVAKRFEAGNVGVNCTCPTTALDMPFSGWKQSGDGREFGNHMIESWTELKSVFIAL